MDRQQSYITKSHCLLLSGWAYFLITLLANIPLSAANKAEPEVIYVACSTCGETVSLSTEDSTKTCSCGAQVDAAGILKRRDERLEKFSEANPELVAQNGCLACHRNIAVINEKMAFIRNIGGPGKGCVVCHEGDANATKLEEAHRGMIRNPADLWECSKGRGCAKCHSKNPSVIDVMSTSTDPLGQRFHV